MSKPRLIIFDVDGTLIDSQSTIIAAMSEAYRAVGFPEPSAEATRSIIGLSLPEAMRVLSPEVNEQAVSDLVEAYRSTFVKRRSHGRGEASMPLYEGAFDCLQRLNSQERNVLGVATGKARRGLDVVIKAHSLDGLFVTMQTADIHPSKPNPAMLDAASKETGIDPHQSVMIGDTCFDMEMGKSAGFATIGVGWGYHDNDRLEAHADLIVENFSQVDAALDRLMDSPR